ncbi:MAG: MarR family transcriptional regulator [Candidatus Thermoplasmatota archaeon]|jgi:DNA-binding MarR family transcriptional regulator|nr:MarR family transcriptional regulator [Candidatus Thermoplasmatota archaeon]
MSGENEIIDRFFRLKKMISLIYRSIPTLEYDISLSDVVVFLRIEKEEEMTLGKLSELTGFSNTLITFTIDSLEKKGLVTRSRGKDRRIVLVTLTERGKDISALLRREIVQKFNALFSKLSQEEMENMISSLDEMLRILPKVVKPELVQ